MTFANFVRQARLDADLTQQQLAQRAGLDQATISLLEKWVGLAGAGTPRNIVALSDALDLPEEVRTLGLIEYVAAKASPAHHGGDPEAEYTRLVASLPAFLAYIGGQQDG